VKTSIKEARQTRGQEYEVGLFFTLSGGFGFLIGFSVDSRQCFGTAQRTNNVSMNIPVTDTLIAKLMTTRIHSDGGLIADIIEAHGALGHTSLIVKHHKKTDAHEDHIDHSKTESHGPVGTGDPLLDRAHQVDLKGERQRRQERQ